MNNETKDYINNLNRDCLPWHRMITAYGTVEKYNELLDILEQTLDVEKWGKCFEDISDFEHQSTMFPPAPFVLVFLVRILKKLFNRNTTNSNMLAKKLIDEFTYYAEVCNDAEQMQHAKPLCNFADMLDEKYLLSDEVQEDELIEIFEESDAIPDDLFYSFYYYSRLVLLQVPEILDKSGKFIVESNILKKKIGELQEMKL